MIEEKVGSTRNYQVWSLTRNGDCNGYKYLFLRQRLMEPRLALNSLYG